jgi:hypothetical protein
VGVVKQIDTTTRTGRLWVYITQLGGPEPDNPTNWKLVSYASPYFGQTTGPVGVAEYSKADRNLNTFTQTSQSYGFYMIPPDIGNKVLCCFIPGSVEGFWFACVNKSASVYMTPAIGAVDYELIEPASIRASGFTLNPTKKYPVGDWNENLPDGYSKPTKAVQKPLHIFKTAQLLNQGLDGDNVRGAITSSSQRDPISSVFGFSTPGRPIPAQDSASDDNLAIKLNSGEFDPSKYKVTARVGGHTLVMDDGDIAGANNLVRLKSSAGHQILMHDTEGIIYVSNSTGTAWVELTKAGDVLIYGAKDLSVRTGGNLMMHSDKNISFFAQENITLVSGKSVAMETREINQTALLRMNIFGKKIQARSASTLDLASASSMSIRSTGKIAINGSAIALNGSGSNANIQNPPSIPKYSLPDVQAQRNGPALQFSVVPGKLISTNYKVPTHEPYFRQGLQQAIEELIATSNTFDTDINGDPISPPIIDDPLGPATAENVPLNDAAPTSAFIDQPAPEGAIGELSEDEVRALTAQIAYSESRGNYDLQSGSFVGKYQFSVDDLSTLGYLREGLEETAENIDNPNNWMNKDNIANVQDFLSSPELQEQAMFNLVKNNYATLQATGAIIKSTAKDEIAGLLSVAHLAGAGGATLWYKTGKYGLNVSGYTAADYFNRGKFSNTQTIVYEQNQ